MAKSISVSFNGRSFRGRAGDLLLDAALRQGVDLPHDCRSGYCGSCTVNVAKGITLGGELPGRRIRACRARVFSDVEIDVNDTPPPVSVGGRLIGMERIAHDTFQLTIQPSKALDFLAGQYCNLRFRGFPERSFSPTADLLSGHFDAMLRFHVKQVRNGRVTPHLGGKIGIGHKVRISGPFGDAYHRTGLSKRLVLVGTGTGFAPVWAVASAALRENPDRNIVLIAGTRRAQSFYMVRALLFASRHPNVEVIPTIERLPPNISVIRRGGPIDHIPRLTPHDIVYAAGAPEIVGLIEDIALGAGASFYSDPFQAARRAA